MTINTKAEAGSVTLLEPRHIYDRAFVCLVAVYDADKCVQAYAEHHGCSHDDAVEWFEYNTARACHGSSDPVFCHSQQGGER